MGNLNQERQHLQSTKPTHLNTEKIQYHLHQLKNFLPQNISTENLSIDADRLDAFPLSEEPNEKTHEVAYSLHSSDEIGKAYSDLTGKFPLQSSRGNNYILVAYHMDANAILLTPVKNRTAGVLLDAWKSVNNCFTRAGLKPKTRIMDNECSNDLKSALEHANIDLQLVPPHQHRANTAERAIQTSKNHLKAGIATVDPKFPLREWDCLLPQCELTLNLLQTARVNPCLSAWAYLFGNFDYNKTPVVPPGTKVVAHSKPTVRATWSLNGEQGWTIGPSLEHYRCIKVFFPKTRKERDVDTVTFFPTVIPFPQLKTVDFLKQAATDIITILTEKPNTTLPSLELGNPERNALLKIADALNQTQPLPTLLPPPKNKK